MVIQNTNEFEFTSEPVEATTQTDRLTNSHQVRYSKDLHEEPVISRLVSHHGVRLISQVPYLANARDDGWFDLELQSVQIQERLTYLDELDLEIWTNPPPKKRLVNLT